MHKGWEQIIAVISCLRVHATYLPIDAGWPAKRIKQLLNVSGAVCVIKTAYSFTEQVDLPVVVIDESILLENKSNNEPRPIVKYAETL